MKTDASNVAVHDHEDFLYSAWKLMRASLRSLHVATSTNCKRRSSASFSTFFAAVCNDLIYSSFASRVFLALSSIFEALSCTDLYSSAWQAKMGPLAVGCKTRASNSRNKEATWVILATNSAYAASCARSIWLRISTAF